MPYPINDEHPGHPFPKAFETNIFILHQPESRSVNITGLARDSNRCADLPNRMCWKGSCPVRERRMPTNIARLAEPVYILAVSLQ